MITTKKKMKFATLDNKARDGTLIVVSRDLTRFARPSTPTTLQKVLDEDQLDQFKVLYDQLNSDVNFGEKLDVNQLLSPLPRAYEWIDGSAYINHIVLVRKARNAPLPPTLKTDPLVYQGGSGVFLRPTESKSYIFFPHFFSVVVENIITFHCSHACI